MLNFLVTIIPLSFSIVYFEIGTILAYTGAFSGFVVIYCLPVMCYLKKKYMEITNPILAEAITHNEVRIMTSKQAAHGLDVSQTSRMSASLGMSSQVSNSRKAVSSTTVEQKNVNQSAYHEVSVGTSIEIKEGLPH